jgi:hypothetical protein
MDRSVMLVATPTLSGIEPEKPLSDRDCRVVSSKRTEGSTGLPPKKVILLVSIPVTVSDVQVMPAQVPLQGLRPSVCQPEGSEDTLLMDCASDCMTDAGERAVRSAVGVHVGCFVGLRVGESVGLFTGMRVGKAVGVVMTKSWL